MGYRANIVTDYRVTYGKQISGYEMEDNYDSVDGFERFLDKLEVEYNTNSSDEIGYLEHEIKQDDLLDLENKLDSLDLSEDEREDAVALIAAAKSAEYAQDGGYLKIHWF